LAIIGVEDGRNRSVKKVTIPGRQQTNVIPDPVSSHRAAFTPAAGRIGRRKRPMSAVHPLRAPRTTALRHALSRVQDRLFTEDLLFLENWESCPTFVTGTMLRVRQLRRANPTLADAIRTELTRYAGVPEESRLHSACSYGWLARCFLSGNGPPLAR
jgi:hypothetical protein